MYLKSKVAIYIYSNKSKRSIYLKYHFYIKRSKSIAIITIISNLNSNAFNYRLYKIIALNSITT
jgi:hypothetical protein